MKKESLGIIVMIFYALGLLALIWGSFNALVYVFNGSMVFAISAALLGTLVMGYIPMHILKGKRREQNKGITPPEYIGLFIYALLAIASFFFIRHYISVEFLLKDALKDEGKAKLSELSDMLKKYEAYVDDTNSTLKLAMDNELKKFQSNSTYDLPAKLAPYNIDLPRKDAGLARTKIDAAFEANARDAKRELGQLSTEVEGLLNTHMPIFEAWNNTQVQRAFREIQQALDRNLATLQAEFKAPDANKAWNESNFTYPITPSKDYLLADMGAFNRNYKPAWLAPLFVTLIIHVFILLPYLAEERFGIRAIYVPGKSNRGIEIK